jgi:hypothetical protein
MNCSLKMKELPVMQLVALTCGLVLATGSAARAALVVTNGDFETGGGNNIDNVSGWLDPSDGIFWHGTWQTNAVAITPNGTNVAVLGSYESGAIQNTVSSNPLDGNYLYQGIGTADGAGSAVVNFDFGAPNDDPGGRTLGLSVAIYAYDGVGTFVPDDNASIDTASQTAGSGVTLLDFNSSFTLVSTGVDGLISTYQAVLSLSGAGSQQLFLSLNNYRPDNTESWPVVDNVSVAAVPEPSVLAMMILALGGMLAVRRMPARTSNP